MSLHTVVVILSVFAVVGLFAIVLFPGSPFDPYIEPFGDWGPLDDGAWDEDEEDEEDA